MLLSFGCHRCGMVWNKFALFQKVTIADQTPTIPSTTYMMLLVLSIYTMSLAICDVLLVVNEAKQVFS